jgi:hypothetical protein
VRVATRNHFRMEKVLAKNKRYLKNNSFRRGRVIRKVPHRKSIVAFGKGLLLVLKKGKRKGVVLLFICVFLG